MSSCANRCYHIYCGRLFVKRAALEKTDVEKQVMRVAPVSENTYTWLGNAILHMKKATFLVCAVAMVACKPTPERIRLVLGTYTAPGKSEGIYVYDFDPVTGETELAGSAVTPNPSFVALSSEGRYLYAVNELGDGQGAVTAFAFDGTGRGLIQLNAVPSLGDHPCHVSIDGQGKYLFISNYSGGNLSVYRIETDGSIGSLVQKIRYTGSGPNAERQKAPHIHSAFFNPAETHLFVQDLGTDTIHIYEYRPDNGGRDVLIPASSGSMATTPGGGPRHMAFSPDGRFAYLVQELTARVEVFGHDDGKLSYIHDVSINESGFEGSDGAAHVLVSPDGKHVYASNRGEANTLAIFAVNGDSGRLDKIGNQSVMGQGPRNFSLSPDGRFLLVGNHQSDEVVVFARDIDSGLLTDAGHRIAVGAPVCIVF